MNRKPIARLSYGMTVAEGYALGRTAGVSGWYFAHTGAHYFKIGTIGEGQLVDYAARKGMSVEEARRWLAPILPFAGRAS